MWFITPHCVLQDYKPEWDPSKVRSEKAGRGPLAPDWQVVTMTTIINIVTLHAMYTYNYIFYFTGDKPTHHVCLQTS